MLNEIRLYFQKWSLGTFLFKYRLTAGKWVYICKLSIVYLHVNSHIAAQSLNPSCWHQWLCQSLFMAELHPVGAMTLQTWPRAVIAQQVHFDLRLYVSLRWVPCRQRWGACRQALPLTSWFLRDVPLIKAEGTSIQQPNFGIPSTFPLLPRLFWTIDQRLALLTAPSSTKICSANQGRENMSSTIAFCTSLPASSSLLVCWPQETSSSEGPMTSQGNSLGHL